MFHELKSKSAFKQEVSDLWIVVHRVWMFSIRGTQDVNGGAGIPLL
jgi:hypothetical protein